ncbi:conserved hypothetical protein [Clostridiaceae bacterium BL-3]|nr:conserved hypothetical protein [Clostridiaceae bacterium BL-3]
MMSKSKIVKNSKPIKFGSQIGMVIDELDRGRVRSVSQKEGSESREAKGSKVQE